MECVRCKVERANPLMVYPASTCPLLPVLKLSGRRDFAPYTAPAQSHYPLRGLIEFWRPREFGSTPEPDAFEADSSAEFTSGRQDLNSPALADIHPVVEREARMGGGRS